MKKKPSRKEMRLTIRNARKAIPAPYAKQASYKFSERFAELEPYQSAKRVAGFLPFDGEADPLPLMDRAILEGKLVYVPFIVAKGQPLVFAPWTRTAKLKKNQFGIEEPDVTSDQMIAANDLDFVINPLVGFDEDCNRLGVGGGYYDRSFQFLNDRTSDPQAPQTTLVGIAFELQKVAAFEPQPHDVPLAGVVTELAIYRNSLS